MSNEEGGLSLSSAVWDRTLGHDTMSRGTFNFLYGLFTLLGLGVTAVFTVYSLPYINNFLQSSPSSIWWLLGGTLVLSILGIIISLRSENPIISAVGYFLVAAPFGCMLSPVVSMYTEGSVLKVLLITIGGVAALAVGGALIPRSLESFGGVLFGALGILLAWLIGIPIAMHFGVPIPDSSLTLVDWIGIVIFGAIVVYDANRAQFVPATMDNAVDCALALYLDVLNIFIRLLSIMGKVKGSDDD